MSILVDQGADNPLPYKIPLCDKTPFKVNCLYFTVNVVKEKDGSTVRDVFHLHYATHKVTIHVLQYNY